MPIVRINTYFANLSKTIFELSEEKSDFKLASQEWDITNFFKEHHCDCCCGKKDISNIFSITNRINNNMIEYIGSSCIGLFENDNLDKQVKKIISIERSRKKVNLYGDEVLKSGTRFDGKTIKFVCKHHPKYVKWLLDKPIKNKQLKHLVDFFNCDIPDEI